MYKLINVIYDNNDEKYDEYIKTLINDEKYIIENYYDLIGAKINPKNIIISDENQYLYLTKYPIFKSVIDFVHLSENLQLKYFHLYPEEYYNQSKEFYIKYITNKYFCFELEWWKIFEKYYNDDNFIKLMLDNNLITWKKISELNINNEFIIKNKNNLAFYSLQTINKLPKEFLYKIKNYVNWNNYEDNIPYDIFMTNFDDIPINKYYWSDVIIGNKNLYDKMIFKSLSNGLKDVNKCVKMTYEQYVKYHKYIDDKCNIGKIIFDKKSYNKFAKYKKYKKFIKNNVFSTINNVCNVLSKKFREYIIQEIKHENYRTYGCLLNYYDYNFDIYNYILIDNENTAHILHNCIGYNLTKDECILLNKKKYLGDYSLYSNECVKQNNNCMLQHNISHQKKMKLLNNIKNNYILHFDMRFLTKEDMYYLLCTKKCVIKHLNVCIGALMNPYIDEYIINIIISYLFKIDSIHFMGRYFDHIPGKNRLNNKDSIIKYAFKIISEKHDISLDFIKKYKKYINIKRIKKNNKINITKDISNLLHIQMPLKNSLYTLFLTLTKLALKRSTKRINPSRICFGDVSVMFW